MGAQVGSAVPSGWTSVNVIINVLVRTLSKYIIISINYICRSFVFTITSSIQIVFTLTCINFIGEFL